MDLFYAVPWSYGTLGFLVSADIQIIPAKQYVRMQYFPALGRQQMIKRFQQETMKQSGNDFVECLVYTETSGVIMTGEMTDDAESNKVSSLTDSLYRLGTTIWRVVGPYSRGGCGQF